MGKQQQITEHQHLEIVDEEPHPGCSITPDSLDGNPNPNTTTTTNSHPLYNLHFASGSGSGSGRSNSIVTTTRNSAYSTNCSHPNCSPRNPCPSHHRRPSHHSSHSAIFQSSSQSQPLHSRSSRCHSTSPTRVYRVQSPSSKVHPIPTWKSLGICAFTGLGGILFGYDTGYINGVMAMPYFENLYLGYSLRPQVVPVTDLNGELVLDKKGLEIHGPISINALRARLPLNEAWLAGLGEEKQWLPSGDEEDDDEEGEEEDREKRNVVLEVFRYEDTKPPAWIRIERYEQPFFVVPRSRVESGKVTVHVSSSHGHGHGHGHGGHGHGHGHGNGKSVGGRWEEIDLDGHDGKQPPQPAWFRLPARDKSLIVGFLSAGTCIGSLLGSDAADYMGRRVALMVACFVFIWGVVNQTVSEHMDLLGRGRFETGLGMGMVSTVIILYMSEISPAPMRGLLVAWYQLCITLGLLISACVNLGTRDMWNTGSFRIPISLQIAWAVILGVGLFFLPESPRWYVKMGKDKRARDALARLRCQDPEGEIVSDELRAIIANHEHELQMAPPGSDTFVGSWANCFRGRWQDRGSNLRRTVLGASVQMFQQISGVNFIFYFGTAFFKQQRFDNVFVIVVIMSAINVASTILSFWLVNNLRRRTLLIAGAVAMAVCQLLVAVAGLVWKAKGGDGAEMKRLASSEPIPAWAFWSTMTGVGAYLFFYAITWGPGAWIITGEIFPLQIRARGVGISTSTNWLWNTLISFLTPVLVDSDHWNLGPGVFVVWGVACLIAAGFTFLFVPETKGLSLEQVDIIFEVPARRSSAYIPPEGGSGSGSGSSGDGPVSEAGSSSGRRFSEFSMTTYSSPRGMAVVK